MPTNKEIKKAWEAHDAFDSEPDCKDRKGWNDKLGHSVFNEGCKSWVLEYAESHPVPTQAPPPSKKIPSPKALCEGCGKSKRIYNMYELETGGYVCSAKCENKAIKRLYKMGKIPPPQTETPEVVAGIIPGGSEEE